MQAQEHPAFDYYTFNEHTEVSDAYIEDYYAWWGPKEDIDALRACEPNRHYLWLEHSHCEPYSDTDYNYLYGLTNGRPTSRARLVEGVMIERCRTGKYTWHAVRGDRLLIETEGDMLLFCGEHRKGVRHGFGTLFTMMPDYFKTEQGYWQDGVLTHVIENKKIYPVS